MCLTDDAPFVMSPDRRQVLPADPYDGPVTDVDNGRQSRIVPGGGDMVPLARHVPTVIRGRDGKEPVAGPVAE